jgi:hypothetical protein
MMLGRSIAKLHYLCNIRPLLLQPKGAVKWRLAHAQQFSKIEREAREFAFAIALPDHPMTGASITDYWFLDAYVRKKHPRRVLELGGGVTTYVLARAMESIGCGELVSVENVEKYADATVALVPAHLHKRIRFHRTSMVGDRYCGENVLRFDTFPPGHYDMIFCDFTDAIGGSGGYPFPAVDGLLALDDNPTDIITDSKMFTLNAYARWLNAAVCFDPSFNLGFVKQAARSDLGSSGSRIQLENVMDAFDL